MGLYTEIGGIGIWEPALLVCAGPWASLKPELSTFCGTLTQKHWPAAEFQYQLLTAEGILFTLKSSFVLIKCKKYPFHLSLILIHCKRLQGTLYLSVTIEQTEFLCEEMKKASTHWANLSEYSFMDCLNAIFPSQTILKSLFYTDENLTKAGTGKWNLEDTNPYAPKCIYTFPKWEKNNYTLWVHMINIHIIKCN